jgi:general secretion pathway protein G
MVMHPSKASLGVKGFTLLELLVVLTIVALLLSLAAPQFLPNIHRAKESVLKHDLATMRDAIDKYYGDTGSFPSNLDQLVTGKYLRKIPLDPITESASTWIGVPADQAESGGFVDVHSGALSKARDGTVYATW